MSLIGQLVALGNSLTQSLGAAATVTYIAAAATDGTGREVASNPPVLRKAIVNKSQKIIKTPSGELVMSTAYVAFLDPAPVSQFDQIILPDGSTGPILSVTSFFDGSNGPILSEVYLG